MSSYDTPVRHDRDREVGRETAVDERVSTSTTDGVNTAMRAIGAVAGAIPVVIGTVALIRIDWGAGFDAAAVDVAGMAFTPVVAIVTVVLGLIAIGAAASPAREGKLVFGGILACAGLAVLIAGDSRSNIDLESGHGWLALLVGAVLVATGLLMRNRVRSRHLREVRSEQH